MIIYLPLFVGLILRLINLNQSLWLDEAVQAVTSQRSFSYIFSELTGDFHPPLFHFLMHYWVRLFGTSEIVLRIPSLISGVVTILVIYKIGKLLWEDQVALIAATFLATAPFHIYYSQEVRMYSLGTLLTSLSVYFFLKISLSESQKDKTYSPRFSLDAVGFVITSVLALYTDYYFLLIIIAQMLAGWLFSKKRFNNFLLLSFIALSFLLPIFPLFFSQIKTGVLATSILPAWGRLVNLNFWKALPLTIIKFSLGRITVFNKTLYALLSLGILFYVLLIGFLGIRRKEREVEKSESLIILSWFMLPLLSAWLISLFIPNYQPFRLILILPAFYLLLAKGISAVSQKNLKKVVLTFTLVMNMSALSVYYFNPFFHREDWRGVAELIKNEKSSIVIFSDNLNWPLIYYRAEERIINVFGGTRALLPEDKQAFSSKIASNDLVYFTPYLASIYDPESKTESWLNEAGFVKIKEISFNQIPLWQFRKNENRH